MRLVVIGGVAAGLSAASRARRLDPSLEALVLEKGPVISWSACGLPYLLEGRVRSRAELTGWTPDALHRRRGIEVRAGAEAVSILHPHRQVELRAGERIRYDRLVIATGASPGRGLLSGADAPHVFTLHTLEETERLVRYLGDHKPRRAAVVGAGYIGLEAADALRSHGLDVTVFESSDSVLGRADAPLTQAVREHLERFRIELRLGETVRSIEPGSVNGLPCDLVLVAAGLKPNVELAVGAGVEIGRTGAIRVSDRMETNLSAVFAAGDCAESTHLVTGKPVWFPLGTTANKMGRVAGASAAGRRDRFPGIVGTSIVRVCGLAVAATGLSAAGAKKEGFDPVSARIQARERPRYFFGTPTTVHLVADRGSGRLLGGTVLGERGAAGRINVIAAALTARMRLEEFVELDLAYAPPYANVWDPLLIAAQQLMHQL